ncbi:RAMP superfamily CRISPR-associated protein [Litoreibacter janthinus]|uniref:CRISPR type III-associated protein domain-containing protein n=1 Tax=Litoreibacter janthinus TaxID=670154 RepID=A0A1I6H076_9RHOB|nr:RAMP superfamily CRISPR-associated protein [Litoreibacter janthinus]SFR47876.1 hypothetical protein SAMN04488002_2248 [Litoreibacter janthinus]
MKRHAFDLNITVFAPFLFPGVAAGRYGLDRVALRKKGGDLVLPMDQVRGILLHGVRALAKVTHDPAATTSNIRALFGAESGDATDDTAASLDPLRGSLFLTDLTAPVPASNLKTNTYPRVRIDEDSGAAAEGQLLFVEQLVAPGKDVDFTGELAFYCTDAEAEQRLQLLSAALRITLSVGSYKSIGFGLIKQETSGIVRRTVPAAPVASLPPESRIAWSFTLDRPYLVDATRIANNAYLGSAAIPGGTLKGCLARNLQLLGVDIQTPEMQQGLAALHVSHARPTGSGDRTIPISIVQDSRTQTFHDLLAPHNTEPEFSPSFALDWKSDTERLARGLLGQTEQIDTFEERVHSAINADTGAVVDEKLFSTISVVPDKKGFQSVLDFGGVAADAKKTIADALMRGLEGLGRTGARLGSNVLTPAQDQFSTVSAGEVCLILLSPGLCAQYDDGADAPSAYAVFWQRIFPNSELLDFYAAQSLVGGYQGRRFGLDDGQYRPWLLTNPGSVFKFALDASDVPTANAILARGLARTEIAGTRLTWENCPFVRENGYGEVSVYHPNKNLSEPRAN